MVDTNPKRLLLQLLDRPGAEEAGVLRVLGVLGVLWILGVLLERRRLLQLGGGPLQWEGGGGVDRVVVPARHRAQQHHRQQHTDTLITGVTLALEITSRSSYLPGWLLEGILCTHRVHHEVCVPVAAADCGGVTRAGERGSGPGPPPADLELLLQSAPLQSSAGEAVQASGSLGDSVNMLGLNQFWQVGRVRD